MFAVFLFTFANIYYVSNFYHESQAGEEEIDGETVTVPERQNYAWYVL